MIDPSSSVRELKSQTHKTGVAFGKAQGAARPEAHRKSTVAKIAFRVAQAIEECTGRLTADDVDYICAVMNARVGRMDDSE